MIRSLLVVLVLPAALFAQANRPAPLVSPEVAADGKVTLRLKAPKAEKVSLNSGDLQAALGVRSLPAMAKGDNDVWSVTIGPVPPGIYDYTFNVDGVTMTDPSSTNVFGNRRGSRGYLEVPGPAGSPRTDEWRKVPHGAVHTHWYDSSAANGARRRVHVYTPPGYEKDGKKYPVLYLLHGSGDNDSHWTVLGQANVIADNLIADGKAVPMVVVMPDGHVPVTGDRSAANAAFETDLTKDVKPLVEGTYRVETDRSKRAITGLSMGGGQSLGVGLKNLDDFAYVGAFSAGVGGAANRLQDPARLNDRLKLFWIAIGKDDFLLQQNRDFVKKLDEAKVKHEYKETAGGHAWPVWRAYLAEFMPRLFKD